jgi:hypothetical protein
LDLPCAISQVKMRSPCQSWRRQKVAIYTGRSAGRDIDDWRARLGPSRADLGSHRGRGHETRAERGRDIDDGRARLRPSRQRHSARIEGGVMRPAPSAGASAARCGKLSRPCHRSDRRSPGAGTASGAGRPSVRPTRVQKTRAQRRRFGRARLGRGLGWEPGTFLSTYADNRKEAALTDLLDSPLGNALLQVASLIPVVSETPGKLHAKLTEIVGKNVAASADWPKTTGSFGNALRPLAPQLRLHGVSIRFEQRHEGG